MSHINGHLQNVSLAGPSGITQHLNAAAVAASGMSGLPFTHSLVNGTSNNNNNSATNTVNNLHNELLSQMPVAASIAATAAAAAACGSSSGAQNDRSTSANGAMRSRHPHRSSIVSNDSMFKCSYCPKKLHDQDSVGFIKNFIFF